MKKNLLVATALTALALAATVPTTAIAQTMGGQWTEPYNAYNGRRLINAQTRKGETERYSSVTDTRTYYYDAATGLQTYYEDDYTENGITFRKRTENGSDYHDITTYRLNQQTKEWEKVARDYEKTSPYGVIESEKTEFYMATGESATIERTTSAYDGQGRPTETIIEKRSGSDRRKTYQYDADGIPFIATYYKGNGGWTPSSAIKKASNAHDMPLIDSRYVWDAATEKWLAQPEEVYEYMNDTLCTAHWQIDEYSGGYSYGWKDEYAYDSQARRTMYANYSLSDTEWTGNSRNEYSYEGNATTPYTDTSYIWDWENGTWTPCRKETSKSDETESLSETMTWNGTDWTLDMRYHTIWAQYGDTLLRTFDEYLQNYDGGSLGNKSEYTYSEGGLMTSSSDYSWNNDLNGWELMKRETFQYDGKGNLTVAVSADNHDWEEMWVATKDVTGYDAEGRCVLEEFHYGEGKTFETLEFALLGYIKNGYDGRGNPNFMEYMAVEYGIVTGYQNHVTFNDQDSIIRVDYCKYDPVTDAFKPYKYIDYEYGMGLAGVRCTHIAEYTWTVDSIGWEEYATVTVTVDGNTEIEERVSKGWSDSYKYRYDRIPVQGGLVEDRYTWEWEEWVPVSHVSNTVVDGHFLHEYNSYNPMMHVWEGIEMTDRCYDANGFVTYDGLYGWDVSTQSWHKTFKREKTYDAAGNVLTDGEYGWNADGNRWDGRFYYEYAYSAEGAQIMTADYFWDSIGLCWNPRMKVIKEDDEFHDTRHYETYVGRGDNWVGQNKWYKVRDEEGRVIVDENYTWDSQRMDFRGSYKYEYRLDEDDYMEIRYDWDDDAWDWVCSRMETRKLTVENYGWGRKLVCGTYLWNGGQWEAGYVETDVAMYCKDFNIDYVLSTIEKIVDGELKVTSYSKTTYNYEGDYDRVRPVTDGGSELPVEFMTLDGKPVPAPVPGGVYLQKQGGSLQKVLLP